MGALLEAMNKLTNERERLQAQLAAIDAEFAEVSGQIGSAVSQAPRGKKRAARAVHKRGKVLADLSQVRDDILLALQDGPLGPLELTRKFSWSGWSIRKALSQLAAGKQIKRLGTNRYVKWRLATNGGATDRAVRTGRPRRPATGLRESEEAALDALRLKSPQTPTELARRLNIHRAALSARVKPLVRKGLVRATGATRNRLLHLPPASAKEAP